ncbi:hypothetical protein OV203_41960 [Nannocystis sp. ILAH1]|uniref:hypothetical protein n=1 Tax=Nannocystis sp. ILAH1 TaxID=2996789 RepID=UPI00226FD111|nr:hypothetical protein [Nannocystis sp. ILAH1]MCY0993778.1 hypothetical protein [Nannocystis sp. ILAH1]
MSIFAVAADSCLRTLYGAYLAIAPLGAPIEAQREARADWFICTMAGESDTGRVWGRVQKLQSGYCIHDRVGGEAPLDVSSCHEVAKLLECAAPTVHDVLDED